MIKKVLLILAASFLLHLPSFGQACTPDAQYTKSGVHPDSATGFDTAFVGSPYSQLITIVVPKDTAVLPAPFPALSWDSTRLDSIVGLPASLSCACWNNNASGNPGACSWKGNTKGCAVITGNPVWNEVGTHPLKFYTSNFVGGSASPRPYVITYYKIVVYSGTGVNENPEIRSVAQNNPNPFSERSEIVFTAEENGTARFKIYNLIGTAVLEYDVKVKKGINRITLDAGNFDSGIYFYSLANGSNTFTRKMIVNK